MNKVTKILLFVISFSVCGYMLYPVMIMAMHSDRLNSLSIKCEQSKKDLASLDLIGERESIETRVNLFMNAKANEFSCFDLVLLENELLANRVSKEKIQFLKLQSISKDPKLIEKIDSYNQ